MPGMLSIKTKPIFPSDETCWNFPIVKRSALGIKLAISTSKTCKLRVHDVGLKTTMPKSYKTL